MTTNARIVDGYAVNVVTSPPSELFHPDWLAKNPFEIVPDGTVSNAVSNGDGTFTNPAPPPPPQPNNPGNPYFKKRPLETKDFYALAGSVLTTRYAL